jgi:hypothetical protein
VKGTLRQGQESSWSLPSGHHTVKVNKTGVGGFFSGIVGSKDVINMSINLTPGEMKTYEMGFHQHKCGNTRPLVYLEETNSTILL